MLFVMKYPKVLLIKNNMNWFLNMGPLYLKAYLFIIFINIIYLLIYIIFIISSGSFNNDKHCYIFSI